MVFPELHFLLLIETDLPIALACPDNILRESATLYIELTTIHDNGGDGHGHADGDDDADDDEGDSDGNGDDRC